MIESSNRLKKNTPHFKFREIYSVPVAWPNPPCDSESSCGLSSISPFGSAIRSHGGSARCRRCVVFTLTTWCRLLFLWCDLMGFLNFVSSSAVSKSVSQHLYGKHRPIFWLIKFEQSCGGWFLYVFISIWRIPDHAFRNPRQENPLGLRWIFRKRTKTQKKTQN